ncbi:MAG: HypC/HybG/HupF family hydrogenase formation chaperone [Betaproteobacteria bacterium]|jgi:hydrogenase expression/formation protein HypC|nr:HypC/HybG/HupF family hydrogenase formation chaperone [Betaproteobacteria bacterium]
MCLAIPARIAQVNGDQGVVDMGGVRKDVSLALLDEVAIGDYVIVHVGFALSKLDPAEAERTLALFAELGAAAMPEERT